MCAPACPGTPRPYLAASLPRWTAGILADRPWLPECTAVNEECFAYDECHLLTPFVEAGKAVFHVEYGVPAGDFCDRARRLDLSSMAKRLSLDAWYEPCS